MEINSKKWKKLGDSDIVEPDFPIWLNYGQSEVDGMWAQKRFELDKLDEIYYYNEVMRDKVKSIKDFYYNELEFDPEKMRIMKRFLSKNPVSEIGLDDDEWTKFECSIPWSSVFRRNLRYSSLIREDKLGENCEIIETVLHNNDRLFCINVGPGGSESPPRDEELELLETVLEKYLPLKIPYNPYYDRRIVLFERSFWYDKENVLVIKHVFRTCDYVESLGFRGMVCSYEKNSSSDTFDKFLMKNDEYDWDYV